MARVTVEDCIKQIPNRFKLVLMAGQRARELSSGAKPALPKNNDKNPVVALKEIATVAISLEKLEDDLTQTFQYYISSTEDADEDIEEDTDDEVLWSLQMAELERGMDGLHIEETDEGEDDDDDTSDSFPREDI